VYIASEDRTRNSNYLGPATVEELAAQIASAHGPSGPNAEYLYRLAEAMAEVRYLLSTLAPRRAVLSASDTNT
jgi:cation transport regulator ChaC